MTAMIGGIKLVVSNLDEEKSKVLGAYSLYFQIIEIPFKFQLSKLV